jgi:hypothetical protein
MHQTGGPLRSSRIIAKGATDSEPPNRRAAVLASAISQIVSSLGAKKMSRLALMSIVSFLISARDRGFQGVWLER